MKQTMKQNFNLENNDKQPSRYFPAHYVCSKCGSNHPYKECPAYHEICQKCFMKGHYTTKCKQTELLNKRTSTLKAEKNNFSGRSLHEQSKPSISDLEKRNREHRPEVNTLENDLCYQTYHMPDKCPSESTCPTCNHFSHNICFNCKKNNREDNLCCKTYNMTGKYLSESKCTTCNHFSHNICFNCEKNRHEHACYYINIVTLPSDTNFNNVNSANQIKLCTNCESKYNKNTESSRKYCPTCQVSDHVDTDCRRKNKQSNALPEPAVSKLNGNVVKSCTKCEFKHSENIGCPRKYCIVCQAYGHWITSCPRQKS